MDIQGKIIHALPQRKGESAKGEWVLQEFVLETQEAFPRKIAFTVFGEERLQRFNIQVGQEVQVSFDIDSREYQGRWYTSIRAYDVRPARKQDDMTQAPMPEMSDPFGAPPTVNAPQEEGLSLMSNDSEDTSDDLPF